jgi:hypothetical protein
MKDGHLNGKDKDKTTYYFFFGGMLQPNNKNRTLPLLKGGGKYILNM